MSGNSILVELVELGLSPEVRNLLLKIRNELNEELEARIGDLAGQIDDWAGQLENDVGTPGLLAEMREVASDLRGSS